MYLQGSRGLSLAHANIAQECSIDTDLAVSFAGDIQL